MIAALLLFGKNHIVGIIIAILALAALTYVGVLRHEVTHYKAENTELSLQMNSINQKNAALAASNQDLTKKYNGSLDDKEQMIQKSSELIAKGIKDDKELNSLRLSNHAVSVFNASKQQTTNTQTTTTAVKGDVSGSSATSTDTGNTGTSQVTLADLLIISGRNDTEHLKCIAQVHEWQNFWKDYVSNVTAAQGD
jgi:hypothetical protein